MSTEASTECPTCGDDFASHSGMKIHHQQSHGESISGEPVDCSVCGETTRKKRCHIENHDNVVCSDECRFELKSQQMKGADLGGKVITKCEWCGDEFRSYKSVQERGKGRFCDRDCDAKWRASITGEEHFNYDGGANQAWRQRESWFSVRDDVKERDDYTCQLCNQRGGELHAHHITPVEVGGAKFDPLNLTTLCRECHYTVHKDALNY